MQTIEEKVAELITPVLDEMNIQLWGIKVNKNPRHQVLQIFIDKEGGVTVDDCGDVTLQINGILDVEDLFKNAYTLEVSSPGLDRILFTLEQVNAYVGKEMVIDLSMPVSNRRHFRGVLTKVEEDILFVECDKEEYQIAYTNVTKAQLIPVI